MCNQYDLASQSRQPSYQLSDNAEFPKHQNKCWWHVYLGIIFAKPLTHCPSLASLKATPVLLIFAMTTNMLWPSFFLHCSHYSCVVFWVVG